MATQSISINTHMTKNGQVADSLILWGDLNSDGVVYNFQNQGNAVTMRNVVSVMVDNTQSAGSISITVEGYTNTLTVQPNMIAVLPIISDGVPVLTVKSSDPVGRTSLIFTDYAMASIIYSPTSVAQAVSDETLEQVISSNAGVEFLRVNDAPVLETLQGTLSVSDANTAKVLAALGETLQVSDPNSGKILTALGATLSVADANTAKILTLLTSGTVSEKNSAAILAALTAKKPASVATSQSLSMDNVSSLQASANPANVSAITVIPLSADAQSLAFNVGDIAVAANATTASMRAFVYTPASATPTRIEFKTPISFINGVCVIPCVGVYTKAADAKSVTSAIVIIETV